MSRRWGAQVALVWLLCALVLVPLLGRLHQITHGDTLDQLHAGQWRGASAFTALNATQRAQQPFAKAGSDVDVDRDVRATHRTAIPHAPPSLFNQLAGHHSASDCLLLDQLALSDALHSTPAALPTPVLAQAPPAPPADRVDVLHVTLFQARGPPLA